MTTSINNNNSSGGGLAALAASSAAAAASAANTTASNSANLLGGTSAAQAQSQFLTLLVAQLNNQDPTNPMDNAQMTTQLAQINTVSGIQQLNQTVTSLTSQMSAMQMMQSSSLVGQKVLVSGSSVTMDGSNGVGGFSLPSAASNVTVNLLNAAGTVVSTVPMGSLSAGNHTFSSDLSGYTGGGALTFQVQATNGSTAVTATPMIEDTVTSIESGTNGMTLNLANNAPVAYSAVQGVL